MTDLINFSTLITQAIPTKRESDLLSLTSIIEILKMKSRNSPAIIACADATLEHLKNPAPRTILYPVLLYSLQRS
jgi:hypothetical protein